MILKISNPREAIIQSYTRPIAYKDYILLDGEVVIAFIQYHYIDFINFYNIGYIYVKFNIIKKPHRNVGFFYCAARASVLGAEYALKEITK